jgi:hypothetical protein
LSVHLAPNAPWLLLLLLTLGAGLFALWAYRFAIPPLSTRVRRLLAALRLLALTGLIWLLAQPVLAGPGEITASMPISLSRFLPVAVFRPRRPLLGAPFFPCFAADEAQLVKR